MVGVPLISRLEKELELLGATDTEKEYITRNAPFCTPMEVKDIIKYAKDHLEIFRKH